MRLTSHARFGERDGRNRILRYVYGASVPTLSTTNVEPSPEDVRTTELIREGGRLLDIAVTDHLVVGKETFCSLRDKGLGFG